jgi:PAS domain S-box-containing protein
MVKKTARSKKPKRSDDLRKRAERLLEESPGRSKTPAKKDLISLVHELQVHQVELEMQNEELRRAQAELEESRNRYFDLYDLAPVAYFTLERNGLILESNLTGARLLGRERKYLEKKPFSRFIPEEDQKIFLSHLKRIVENGKKETCELRLLTRDATTVYVRMVTSPVRNGIEDVIQVRSAVINITRQKQAEVVLRESEKRFRLIAETSDDIIFQLDTRGIILYCSPSIEKILGYTLADVKGNPLDRYLAPSDVSEARESLQRLLFGEKIPAFELNVFSKSGTSVPFEVAVSSYLEKKVVKFIFGIARDITDRKLIEEALKRREEHLRVAVEGGNLGTWEHDLITGETIWNYLLYDFLGRDPSRPITGETFFEYIHKEDLPRIRERLKKAYRNKTEFMDEFRIIREDGQERWLASFGRIYRDLSGQPILNAGVNLDISERKRAEQKLRESEERASRQLSELEIIYHSAPVGLCVFDREFRYTRINNRLAEMNGVPAKEHIGRTPWEVVPDLAPTVEPIFKRVLHSGQPVLNAEFSGVTLAQPSVVRFWNEHWLPIKDAAGRVIGVNVVAEDITERKQFQAKLIKYQDELETEVTKRTEKLAQANKQLMAEVARRERYEEALRGATKKILMESKRRRFLSGKLVETLERDRRDVAMYLHDQIGQMLATLRMELVMMRKRALGASGPPNDKLRRLEDRVVGVMEHVREITRRLRPDVLDTLGLVPALRSLVEIFRNELGLRIRFYYKELSHEISPEKSLALYRIAQEALNNVSKHAQATEVFVNLILKNDAVQLTVEDDGIGFNCDEIVKSHAGEGPLGIMIMRERAVLAGGELSLESDIGKGTNVVAEIPID